MSELNGCQKDLILMQFTLKLFMLWVAERKTQTCIGSSVRTQFCQYTYKVIAINCCWYSVRFLIFLTRLLCQDYVIFSILRCMELSIWQNSNMAYCIACTVCAMCTMRAIVSLIRYLTD